MKDNPITIKEKKPPALQPPFPFYKNRKSSLESTQIPLLLTPTRKVSNQQPSNRFKLNLRRKTAREANKSEESVVVTKDSFSTFVGKDGSRGETKDYDTKKYQDPPSSVVQTPEKKKSRCSIILPKRHQHSKRRRMEVINGRWFFIGDSSTYTSRAPCEILFPKL